MLSEEARKIADEAKEKGLWIYSPSYKWWYSPEDFKHSFTYANATEDFLKQLQIRDPLEGVNAGFQRIKQLQDKLDVFAKRVLEYYRK